MNQRRHLLALARKGDQKAVSQLMELYQVRVYSGDSLRSLKVRKSLPVLSPPNPKDAADSAKPKSVKKPKAASKTAPKAAPKAATTKPKAAPKAAPKAVTTKAVPKVKLKALPKAR